MIAIDTNIVVRVLTQDDATQAKKAAAVLRSGPTFLPKTVIIEVEWVLRRAYGFERAAINEALKLFVGLDSLEVEDRAAVMVALAWHAAGMDLADATHLASSEGATAFATFDAALARNARAASAIPGVKLLT